MTTLQKLAALFDQDGIRTEGTEKQLLIPVRGGAYGTRIITTQHGKLFRVRVSISLFAPQLRLEEVRHAIRLVNRKVNRGSFIVAEDGEVCFRVLLPTEGKPHEEHDIKRAVQAAWQVMATHSTALVEVALGSRAPNAVLKEPHKNLPLDLKEAVRPERD